MKRIRNHTLILSMAASAIVALALGMTIPAHAAAPQLTNRPRAFVAYVRPAVVRLVAVYYAQVQGQADLVPAPVLCTGLGTIVATTGANDQTGGGNAHTYVLTDATVVNPIQPCPGAAAAYLSAAKTPPTSWKLGRVTAYMSTSYSGDDAAHVGAVSYDLDITTIPTLSGLIALPLLHEPAYDLPVAAVPATQPSAPAQLLDLGNPAWQPYTSDTISGGALAQALTVIESGVAQPPPMPTAAPASTPTGVATAVPTTAATPATASPTVAAPTPRSISLGAPVISDPGDGAGQLTGMVVQTPSGPKVAGVVAINNALRAAFATANPGAFDQRWHAGLQAYYVASPTNTKDANYAAAAQQFLFLQQQYPDFHGVAPWLAAAQAGSPDLGVNTVQPHQATVQSFWSRIPIHSTSGWFTAGVALVVLLLGLYFLIRALGGRQGEHDAIATDDDVTGYMPALKGGPSTPKDRRPDQEALSQAWRATSLKPTVPLARNRVARRLGMQTAGLTDPGIRRKNDPNQDSILVVEGARLHDGKPQPFGLLVVADGMGGHQNGREASMHTVQVIAEHMLPPLLGGDVLDEDAMLELLRSAVEHANESLHYRNLRQNADMGTTVTAALVTGDIAHVVNVGDSRTYHLQTALPLRPVTVDHSVVASLVAAGVIRPDDVYTHPKRNQIYRSLGEQEEVQVDSFQVVMQPGEHLLLCSDGLWEMIRDPRIEEMLRQDEDLNQLAQHFVEEANANGGVDNVSVVLVRMFDETPNLSQVGARVLAGPPTIKGV